MFTSIPIISRNLIIIGALLCLAGCGMSSLDAGAGSGPLYPAARLVYLLPPSSPVPAMKS
jgi:hypothetical protein